MVVSHRARSLRCILSGKVVSLGLLQGARWESRCGYAVLPPKSSALKRYLAERIRRFSPKLSELLFPCTAVMTSPADGVVTERGEGTLTLRTGDGVYVTVVLGKGITPIADTGDRVRCSTVICRTTVQALQANGHDGAVAVFFPEPSQITELHIFSGSRRAHHRTAFYRVHR